MPCLQGPPTEHSPGTAWTNCVPQTFARPLCRLQDFCTDWPVGLECCSLPHPSGALPGTCHQSWLLCGRP